jgi:hypothetical protein
MDRFHGPTPKLPIDMPGQRAALLRCCVYVRERDEGKQAQIAEPALDGPRGVHIRQGAEIMASLVALDTELEREVMPLAH